MDPPKPPQYQPPPEDPQTVALRQRALADQTMAAQETARIDSASLLARYGTLVSVANAGAPTAPGAAAVPLSSDPARALTSPAALPQVPRVA